MDQVGLYRLFRSASTRLASTFIRHGELRLLHQWVCATSPLRGLSRPNSPRKQIHWPLRVARLWFPLGELRASDFEWSLELARLWSSPLTRHCELLAFGSPLASWVQVISILFVNCSPLTRLWPSFTRHGELTFVLLCFSSLLHVLGSIPAQMGKVRQIKRNRVFNTYRSTFPSITCKTRNKCALIIPLKYNFLALIKLSPT